MNPSEINTFAITLQRQLYQLVKSCEQCDKVSLTQHKVTSSQGYTLLALPQEGGLSMYELSEAMGITCSTMTRIVTPLVNKGLVQRRNDDVDRRIVRVSLTEQGQKLKLTLDKEFQDFFKYVLGRIQVEELQTVLNSMEKVNMAFIDAFKNYCAT